MTERLRLDFPEEVVRERTGVYDRIRALLAEQTLPAIQQAKRLHLEWLRRFPDDYVALDAGEILAMSESAYDTMHEKKTDNNNAEHPDAVTSLPLKAASA